MEHAVIVIRAEWDENSKVWVATSNDIDGLATEARTLEALQTKVLAMVAELMELNGLTSDFPEIPVHIMSSQTAKIRNPNWN